MNFTNEFRNSVLVKKLLSRIKQISKRNIRIMEVCGGHTMAIRKYGIHNLLPSQIDAIGAVLINVVIGVKHVAVFMAGADTIPAIMMEPIIPHDSTLHSPAHEKAILQIIKALIIIYFRSRGTCSRMQTDVAAGNLTIFHRHIFGNLPTDPISVPVAHDHILNDCLLHLMKIYSPSYASVYKVILSAIPLDC